VKTTARKKLKPLPSFVPQWIQRRVGVDDYALFAFVEESCEAISAGSLVLDAGAGEGQYRQFLQHARYVGVDLAVGDVQWNYAGLEAVSDLSRLPFEANTFDAVLCTQVLEHVREPKQVLCEISRVLKPEGHLYLSTPQSSHQHQKPYDYYRYTSFGLRYLLEEADLVVDVIKPMGGYFWYLSFQLRNIDHWLFPKGKRSRRWFWPLRAVLAVVFQVIFPIILFYLDPLDQIRDETFGYVCVAHKPPLFS
jgi:SAM-dependent methyltransferase